MFVQPEISGDKLISLIAYKAFGEYENSSGIISNNTTVWSGVRSANNTFSAPFGTPSTSSVKGSSPQIAIAKKLVS